MRKQRRRSDASYRVQLISTFVFASKIVQTLYFLNMKFQASSHLLWLYNLVCMDLVGKPEGRFSHVAAHTICFRGTNYQIGIRVICRHVLSLKTKKNRKNLSHRSIHIQLENKKNICFVILSFVSSDSIYRLSSLFNHLTCNIKLKITYPSGHIIISFEMYQNCYIYHC